MKLVLTDFRIRCRSAAWERKSFTVLVELEQGPTALRLAANRRVPLVGAELGQHLQKDNGAGLDWRYWQLLRKTCVEIRKLLAFQDIWA